ncbi:MAG: hypothetical protein ACP5N1_02760 [Candidatus Woesearchaeota archaeon]
MYNYLGLFNEERYRKTRKETGLNEETMIWYDAIISESNIITGIVKYEDISERVLEEFEMIGGEEFEYNKDNINKIHNMLPDVLEYFKRKKLIDYKVAEDGKIYPRLIGYNYFNDPQFYMVCRKIGNTEWDKRMPVIVDTEKIIECLIEGYEFREQKDIKFLLD